VELAQSAIWRRRTQLVDGEFIELADAYERVHFTNAERDNTGLQNEPTRTYLERSRRLVASMFQSIHKAYRYISLRVRQNFKLAFQLQREKKKRCEWTAAKFTFASLVPKSATDKTSFPQQWLGVGKEINNVGFMINAITIDSIYNQTSLTKAHSYVTSWNNLYLPASSYDAG
jgi:hypothetical protein